MSMFDITGAESCKRCGENARTEVERLQIENTKLREKIVRCKDCKRFSLDNSDHDYRSGWWCHRWNTDMVNPDGFCAWGKRA